MPIPKPNSGEGQNDYIGRCIRFLEQENADKPSGDKRPHDQIIAICEQSWRDSKSSCGECSGVQTCSTHGQNTTHLTSILDRLMAVKDALVRRFGVAGQAFFESTLVRLGVYDPKSDRYNCNLLKADIALPFIKVDTATEFAIGNMVLGEVDFGKVDEVTHTVSGYANTLICDCVGDIVLPEAYRSSAEAYKSPIHFMHHRDIDAGDITTSKTDEIGWWVDTRPRAAFWPMIADKTLKGFSIGGWFKGVGQQVGESIVWTYGIAINDLSYVTRPCNKLSYFEVIKSDGSKSSNMTVTGDELSAVTEIEDSALKKIIGVRKMSKLEQNPNAQPAIVKEEPKKLTLNEQVEQLLKERDAENEAAIMKTLTSKRSDEIKAKEQDRLGDLEKRFGSFEVKFNELFGKIDAIASRMTKMEELPAVKASSSPAAADKSVFVKVAEIVNESTSLSQALDTAENLVPKNTGE